MKSIKLIERYADAFIQNIPKDRYSEVAEDLKLAADAFEDHVTKFLISDIVDEERKIAYLESVDSKVNFPKEIKNLLVVLVRRNRIDLIHGIYFEYIRLMNRSYNKGYVTVETRYPLSDSVLTEIKQALKKRFKQEIAINEKLNPELIAGVIIKKDDFVIDLSVNGRLSKIRSTLLEKVSN